jgi:hypothetical protein
MKPGVALGSLSHGIENDLVFYGEASVKFGIRKPSLKRRMAARTSLKRYVRHTLGLKAPRGWGWITKFINQSPPL